VYVLVIGFIFVSLLLLVTILTDIDYELIIRCSASHSYRICIWLMNDQFRCCFRYYTNTLGIVVCRFSTYCCVFLCLLHTKLFSSMLCVPDITEL